MFVFNKGIELFAGVARIIYWSASADTRSLELRNWGYLGKGIVIRSGSLELESWEG